MFQNDEQVVRLARALRENKCDSSTIFQFSFQENPYPDAVNWAPLVQAFELFPKEGQKIQFSEVPGIAAGSLSMLCISICQALKRNPNILDLCFQNAFVAEASIVPILEAQSLTNLTLDECSADPNDTVQNHRNMAAALERNNHGLKELDYSSAEGSDYFFVESLAQYLGSASCTIQRLRVESIYFGDDDHPKTSSMSRALRRNTSVTVLVFDICDIAEDDATVIQEFANLVRREKGPSSLHFQECNFFSFPEICDALKEVLLRRKGKSPLRCLTISCYDCDSIVIPIANFRILLQALTNSTQLECLSILDIKPAEAVHVQALLGAVACIKVGELTVSLAYQQPLLEEDRERFLDVLLDALRKNYIVKSVSVTNNIGDSVLDDTKQARLAFYLDRNHKLAEWIENPSLVPRELVSYAVMLALKAGANQLYQSLMTLSGEGIGLEEKKVESRKR